MEKRERQTERERERGRENEEREWWFCWKGGKKYTSHVHQQQLENPSHITPHTYKYHQGKMGRTGSYLTDHNRNFVDGSLLRRLGRGGGGGCYL